MSIILGGGIGGLSAAYYFLKRFPGQAVALLEASNRVGGWIQSTRIENGVVFEQAPRTLRVRGEQGHNTLELIEELGIDNEIVPVTFRDSVTDNRMIYLNNNLYTLPSSLKSFLTKTPPFSKSLFRYLLNDLFVTKKEAEDESLYDFIERRFGREVADYAISPMVCGICAGDAKKISVKFLMRSQFENEQRYGSVLKGMVYERFKKKTPKNADPSKLVQTAKGDLWLLYTLKNGLETLPLSLRLAIEKDVHIVLNSPCTNIEFKGTTAVVKTPQEELETSHLISSLPASKLSPLLDAQHPQLANLLSKIRSVSVGVVNLHYDKKVLKIEGFGYLVPPMENSPILGVVFDSCSFPVGENTVLTVMLGGEWFEKHFGNNPSPEQILETALKNVENVLQIKTPPKNYKVNILRNCIPQYDVGHEGRVNKIRGYIKANNLPLYLCGASFDGVGVNDVIMSARRTVENIGQ